MICIICEMKCEHFQKLYNNYLHYNCAIKMDPEELYFFIHPSFICLLYTSPSPRDGLLSRMPSSA